MNLPVMKLITIEDNAINNPPMNKILLFLLKFWIKKFVICFINKPIASTGWMKSLGSPINRSNPIEAINMINKFISAN